jgi:hypothetical protein
VDQVADALQRYLGVRPRYEPTADPRDEASVARHPQGLLQAGRRWADDASYQFTANGVANYRISPDYRAWGGALDLELTNQGLTTVSAPPTISPRPGARVGAAFSYYDPAYAVQEAMARMEEVLAQSGPAGPRVTIGPPNMVDNPYFDPPFTAQNALDRQRADLAAVQPAGPLVAVGPPNMARNPAYAPDQAWSTAVRTPGQDADYQRARQIRDDFIRTRPALSDWI